MSQKTTRPFHILQKALKRFLKVIYCTQQLQVRENVVGFEKALGAVKVIKDQIQYGSQSLLNLASDYFSNLNRNTFPLNCQGGKPKKWLYFSLQGQLLFTVYSLILENAMSVLSSSVCT